MGMCCHMGREKHGALIVVASVVAYIPVAGIINSFGVFVEKLNVEFCPFDCLQLLGWIGALTFGLNRAFCWLVMELQTMVSPFLLFLSGILMCTLSLLLTSMTERLAWLFLFYCVIYGFGSSLVMNTPYSLIEEVFPITHKHHVTATSIMNVGAPLGMLLVNPLVAYLDNIEGHTWRDTIRIFSLVVLITGFVCSLPMTRRGLTIFGTSVNPKEGYEDLDKQCSDVTGADQSDIQGDEKPKIRRKEPPARQNSLVLLFENQTAGILLGWTSGMFLLSVAIFIPKVHFIQYMHDLSIEPEVAAACMSYEGLAEATLSLLISILGDPIAPYFMWMYALCSALLAVGSSILVMSTRVIHIAVYCTIHGAVDGLLMTTIYPTLQLLTTNVKAKQLLWSLTLFVIGVGQVVGLPMAGLIYDETRSYSLVFYIASGVFGTAAFAFLVICIKNASRDVESQEVTSRKAGIMGDVHKQGTGYKSLGDTRGLSKDGPDSRESGSAETQDGKSGAGITRRFTEGSGDSGDYVSADLDPLDAKSVAVSTTRGTASDIHQTTLKEDK